MCSRRNVPKHKGRYFYSIIPAGWERLWKRWREDVLGLGAQDFAHKGKEPGIISNQDLRTCFCLQREKLAAELPIPIRGIGPLKL